MPRKTIRKIHFFLIKHRLLVFLITLLSLLIIFPFIHELYSGYLVIVELFFSILLIAGIYIVSTNKQLLTVAVLLAMLTFTVIWFNIFMQNQNLLIFGLILQIIFFAVTTITIITHVLEYRKVTADKIYGAICGYLLIGFIWGLGYTLLETLMPNSFNFTNGLSHALSYPSSHPIHFYQFFYFSYITLTTLGYGDVTPITNITRAFSSLEAITGQLYLAVLIARLVGLHISHTLLTEGVKYSVDDSYHKHKH